MPEIGQIEPLKTPHLSDYHCHCDFSIDAEGTISEYCDVALRRGLRELCFTTHYDTNPYSEGDANLIRANGQLRAATAENFAHYVTEVRRSAREFEKQGLTVKCGVEFGYYPNCEEAVCEIQEEFELDYTLCGLHELDNICFCCKDEYAKCYAKYTLDKMLDAYFRDMIDAANMRIFDTIAHFDYYKKYAVSFYGESVLSAHSRFLPDVFAALKQTNTAIEINTAALRRGFPTHYPTPEIIQLAVESGVRVARLGSDAHHPCHVGWDFDNAFALQNKFATSTPTAL